MDLSTNKNLMSPELELQLKHQLKLNPQLQQSLKLLQLSQLELAHEIQNQLESNPLLQSEDADNDSAATNKNSSSLTASVGSTNLNSGQIESNDFWESIPEQSDLKEKLEFQLQLHPLSRLDLEIGYYIIENLNEQGFLTVSEEEICQQLERDTEQQVEASEVLAVLHLIQTLEPSGCGCKNLQEFMLFQLSHSAHKLKLQPETNANLEEILNEHFQLLVEQQYQKLETKLAISNQQMQKLLTQLQQFRQRPNDYATDRTNNYVRPDIKVFRDGNIWQAQITQNQLPKLSLNNDYLQLAKTASNKEDKKFIKDKTIQAQQFITSLEARQSTLQKVANYLIKVQANYFESGDKALKPLRLADVAESLDLHESTISRATSNKYCQTPNGLIKLKSLFSNAINTEKGGEWSQTAVKHQIQQLIDAEPSRKPLSDNSIVSLLAKQGISIARRTVTKYRDALRIPSASKRKQLSSLRQTN